MENRFQLFLLTACLGFSSVPSVSAGIASALSFGDSDEITPSNIDKELFDIGVVGGVVNIDNASSAWLTGLSANFQASEDFFLQFNAAIAADVELSSYEESQGALFVNDDRDYYYYDFLLGYKLLQGEVFVTDDYASLSALYLLTGVGNSEFGGEANFTYSYGVGYQIELVRRYIVRLDWRDRLYRSDLLEEDDLKHNMQLTLGLSYLF
ncbi:outer membrane beta-barrel protein [Sinobacterium caligoides]|uniref:Outer membrane beta-barrel protein n=1 Tax=Sinobacterium caligoides TaxID=933926 RepID=A0A3N2DPF5_9GAMM|nr:outer membrane beta-barrel domain-containing protein [Sinobacterium caligoides]ROS01205.1 outer membrane beta-barrel protein [Sinobacterium caligoides]